MPLFFIEIKKRGFVGQKIWSGTNAPQRAAAGRLQVPSPIAKFMMDVFFDHSYSLSDARRDPSKQTIVEEYQRWMAEKGRRLQRDPLPVVKRELAEVIQ